MEMPLKLDDKRLLKYLRKSKIFNELIKEYSIVIRDGLDSMIILDGSKLILMVNREFSLEARAGLIILELYYLKSKGYHTDHIATAFKLSTEYEKKLMAKGIIELLGIKQAMLYRDDKKLWIPFIKSAFRKKRIRKMLLSSVDSRLLH